MKELRVYTDALSANAPVERLTFYTRRADGPYYLWFYESEPGRWRFSRIHVSKLTLRVLAVASWQAVPVALQARLTEHYLD
jgi:hypothetical protein